MTQDYERLRESAQAVREYGGGESFRVLDEFLQELDRSYAQELRSCRLEELAPLQKLLTQLENIRRVMAGDTNTDGRV